MHTEPPEDKQQVTCISEGNYAEALSYGKIYDVIAWDEAKRQMRVRGDNNRTRWYPSYCFAIGAIKIPRLAKITLRDLDEKPSPFLVEVDVELSDGQRRWCDFVTPAFFSQLGGAETFAEGRLLLYNMSHMIVVSNISQEMVEASLTYIERQGELFASTQAIE